MATIKSYTDINQSKKLADILPLESADMWWLYITAQGKHIAMMYEEPDPHYLARMESYGIKDAAIRCWSLAALLNTLPEYNLQRTDWGDKTEYKIVVTTDEDYYASKNYDNPVDACVAMIEKLNELKML